MAGLRNILGLEIGSMTIGGEMWSKVVLEPTFQSGKLKAALYLPLIYQDDMFNPSDYYRPAGNREWSFGSDQHSTVSAVQDFAVDLLLKIKYIEWGQQSGSHLLQGGKPRGHHDRPRTDHAGLRQRRRLSVSPTHRRECRP